MGKKKNRNKRNKNKSNNQTNNNNNNDDNNKKNKTSPPASDKAKNSALSPARAKQVAEQQEDSPNNNDNNFGEPEQKVVSQVLQESSTPHDNRGGEQIMGNTPKKQTRKRYDVSLGNELYPDDEIDYDDDDEEEYPDDEVDESPLKKMNLEQIEEIIGPDGTTKEEEENGGNLLIDTSKSPRSMRGSQVAEYSSNNAVELALIEEQSSSSSFDEKPLLSSPISENAHKGLPDEQSTNIQQDSSIPSEKGIEAGDSYDTNENLPFDEKIIQSEEEVSTNITEDIAKQEMKESVDHVINESSPLSISTGGGIAELAASAAREKNHRNTTSFSPNNSEVEKQILNTPSLSEKLPNSHLLESTISSDISKISLDSNIKNEISFIEKQLSSSFDTATKLEQNESTRKMNITRALIENESVITEDDRSTTLDTPLDGGGGIAAMTAAAAAAAVARNKNKRSESMDSYDDLAKQRQFLTSPLPREISSVRQLSNASEMSKISLDSNIKNEITFIERQLDASLDISFLNSPSAIHIPQVIPEAESDEQNNNNSSNFISFDEMLNDRCYDPENPFDGLDSAYAAAALAWRPNNDESYKHTLSKSSGNDDGVLLSFSSHPEIEGKRHNSRSSRSKHHKDLFHKEDIQKSALSLVSTTKSVLNTISTKIGLKENTETDKPENYVSKDDHISFEDVKPTRNNNNTSAHPIKSQDDSTSLDSSDSHPHGFLPSQKNVVSFLAGILAAVEDDSARKSEKYNTQSSSAPPPHPPLKFDQNHSVFADQRHPPPNHQRRHGNETMMKQQTIKIPEIYTSSSQSNIIPSPERNGKRSVLSPTNSINDAIEEENWSWSSGKDILLTRGRTSEERLRTIQREPSLQSVVRDVTSTTNDNNKMRRNLSSGRRSSTSNKSYRNILQEEYDTNIPLTPPTSPLPYQKKQQQQQMKQYSPSLPLHLEVDSKVDNDEEHYSPAPGIGTLAAAAARKKQSETSKDAGPVGLPAVGIGALAAAAARKKQAESTEEAGPGALPAGGIGALAAAAARKKQSHSSDSAGPGGLPAGGIGALAAAAARKKQAHSSDSAGPGGLPAGGIGALAAAAARKKQSHSSDSAGPGGLPAGGIGSLAAAAARKKQSESSDDTGPGGLPAGGIGVLAAAAARKKQSESSDNTGPGALPAGGIGALAAAAARKKQSESSEGTAPGGLPAGGIGALAAAAARKKQSESSDDTGPGGLPAGGIGALAAAAARKKQSEPSDESPSTGGLPTGGIGALAAAAARKKQSETSDETGLGALPAGGIGTLAAAAARKKESKSFEDTGPGGLPAGGIGALAAAAARKQQSESSEDAGPGGLPGGGIGALAAAAARKKQAEPSDEAVSTEALPTGGIGALAAAAARKKQSESSEDAGPGGLPAGGIGELAAAAARKKQSESSDNTGPGGLPVVGIGALAAAAARKKQLEVSNNALPAGGIGALPAAAARKKQSETSDDTDPDRLPAGGIGALAAAAASKKQSETSSTSGPGGLPVVGIGALAAAAARKKQSESSVESPSTEDIPAGGIGALAAAAARKKQTESSDESPSTGDLPAGGIGALAAAAARKKQSETSDDTGPGALPAGGIGALAAATARKKQSKSFEDTGPGGLPAGGIGALAAAAARKKQAESSDNTGPGGLPAGGIGALAAAAAKKKQAKSFDESPSTGGLPAGGIGALAAAAARKKQSESSDNTGPGALPAGGIGALAAAAARKKQSESSEDTDPNVLPAGGIGALAAAAARKKQSESSDNAGSGGLPAGGIGALAAAAARKKQSEKSDNTGPGALPAGGIGALAAAAARKKQSETSDNAGPGGFPAGGIGALAAAAARKKQSESSDDTGPGGLPAGGIGALAAAAARKKQSEPSDESPSTGGLPTGGVGALAAAAARKKQSEVSEDAGFGGLPAGGIGALAAAAARKKQFSESSPSSLRAGGIGALAAAAAKKKHTQFSDGSPSVLGSSVKNMNKVGSSLLHHSQVSSLNMFDHKIDIFSNQDVKLIAHSRWLQMVSRWKHSEMILAMTSRATSQHFISSDIIDSDETISKDSHLGSMNNNLSGFLPADQNLHAEIPILSSFLTDLGRNPRCMCRRDKMLKGDYDDHDNDHANTEEKDVARTKSSQNTLQEPCIHLWVGDTSNVPLPHSKGSLRSFPRIIRHRIRAPSSISAESVVNILCQMANSSMNRFYAQMDELVRCSCITNPLSSSSSSANTQMQPSFSVDVKSPICILQKAVRKYNGDVLQVKDVLRGQITFPNEGSLISCLALLSRSCDNQPSEKWKGVKTVRFKNLFKMSALGVMVPSDLPTGYRHILCNIRLSNGLIAEIQLQLFHMFDILGNDGYRLHHDLIKIESEFGKKQFVPLHELVDCKRSRKQATCPPRTNSERNPLLLCQCAEANTSGSHQDSFDSYLSKILELLNGHYIQKADAKKKVNLLLAMAKLHLQHAPRDIASHFCFQKVLEITYLLNGDDSIIDQMFDTLDRSLEIANQAGATGMMGWLEYGSSSPIDRMVERPLDIMGKIASIYSSLGDWDSASVVLWSLHLRCEQHLPLYHPLSLSAMLDLSAALLELGQGGIASKLIHRTNLRLSMYLLEQEDRFLKYTRSTGMKNGAKSRNYKSENDPIVMLQAFLVKMKRQQKRHMSLVLSDKHPINLLLLCFLGDTITVLANCLTIRSSSDDTSQTEKTKCLDLSQNLWSIGGECYRVALDGWVRMYGIRHPNVPVTSCGLARSLREVGCRAEAIVVLSSVVGAWKGNSPLKDLELNNNEDERPSNGMHEKSLFSHLSSKNSNAVPVDIQSQNDLTNEEGLALCLWWMAVYFVESSPTERGRIRALSLLHASSESLQLAFKKSSCTKNFDLLTLVEKEAKELFSFEILKAEETSLVPETNKLNFVMACRKNGF